MVESEVNPEEDVFLNSVGPHLNIDLFVSGSSEYHGRGSSKKIS